MKTSAAILYEMERPRPYAVSRPLVVDEVDLAGPGPGQVLVEIAAAGVCHSDLSVVDGTRPRVMPMVLGHEAAGIIRELGREVHDLQSGDHVVMSFVPMCGQCLQCAIGRPALCVEGNTANAAGRLLDGSRPFTDSRGRTLHHHLGVSGFSQFTVVARESIIPIDPEVPLEIAVMFGCAVITGVGAVVNTARVPPGSSVTVFGLGGVGLSAVMGARAAGADPIVAVDVVAAKLELAGRLGATHRIDARTADPVEAVRGLTGGGSEYAFECAGAEDSLAQAYAATARGGTTITVSLPHPSRHLSVSAVNLVVEERTVKGSYMGSAVPRRDIPRFLALHRAGLLPVEQLVSQTLILDEINGAFDALAEGQVVRQVVRLVRH